MEIVRLEEKTTIKKEIKKILQETEDEFVPPLSSRKNGVRETKFNNIDNTGIESYLNDLMDQIIFVSKKENNLTGFISLNKSVPNLTEIKKPSAYITTVITKPKERNKGVATELVSKTKKYAQAKNMKALYTRTWSTNQKSISLFKKSGFQVEKIVEDDRKKGIDSIYMYWYNSDKNEK